MIIETINVGDRFKFKTGLCLTNEADGKEFTVVSLDFRLEIIHLKFDDSDILYNVSFDIFNHAVADLEKWRGSKLVFNFV